MSPWVVGIVTSLIATVIAGTVVRMIPEGGAFAVWQRYWPEFVALVVGAMWFGGYWVRVWSQRLRARVAELERQVSDPHLEHVIYRVVAPTSQRATELNGRVQLLEEWKLQGGGDSAEAFAHRVLKSTIDPQRGGMDVKP
jgi:hypothetical protein